MRALILWSLTGLCTLAVAGCDMRLTHGTAAAPPGGSAPCIAGTVAAAGDCEPGRVLAYLPERRGDDREPLVVAARHCDFGRAVVWNAWGVVCVRVDRAGEVPAPMP